MFEIGNAELDERNQYITYHNISVTVSFLMRLNEFDEPNHMSIARDDCLAYFTFDLRLYLDEDNYLEPISYNVTSFEIADLDLFRLKLYKDKISNKESAIEQILSTFTLERLYNISRMYPMSDQDYYFTILVNHNSMILNSRLGFLLKVNQSSQISQYLNLLLQGICST